MEPDDYSKEELYNQIQELRQDLNKIKEKGASSESHNEQNNSDNTTLSRRSFLKKAGLGVAGLGAMFSMPAAGLDIRSSDSLSFNDGFSVGSTGNVEVDSLKADKLSLGSDGPAKNFSEISGGDDLGSLKPVRDGVAVVAPSHPSAYDGIQQAIDSGERDIILAEEITEAGITIPRVDREGSQTDSFRLTGVGDGQYQTINDPGTHEYVIRAEPGDTRAVNGRVLIQNIFFDRETSESGFCILGAKNIHDPDGPWNAAGNWMIRDVVSRAGPIALVGPRNLLHNVDIANWSTRMFPIIGKTDNDTGKVLYDRYAGLFRGATFGMQGGALLSKTAARSAAYFGTGGWSITGGVTFTNAREHRDQEYFSNNVCFMGATRGFLGGCSTEGSTDYDVQFGLEDSGDGPGDAIGGTFISGSSAFESLNIQTSCRNTIIHTFRDCTIRKEDYGKLYFMTENKVEMEDGVDHWLPHEINHVNFYDGGVYRVGGGRNSPSTPFGLKVHSSKPKAEKEATFVVADGANWDPVGNGNAALVTYDTDGNWKPVFEYSDPL